MSGLTQRPAQSSKHSQFSTSTAPGLDPSSSQDHGLSQESIDGLFTFDSFHNQNFDEWFGHASTENMWQPDHGLFDGLWSSGAVTDHQFGSPMSVSERISQHPPSKGSTPTYPIDELSSGLPLDYDDDGLQAGVNEVTHRQDRQRSEPADNNSTGANSTKGDSPNEEKRKMQNRQAQRAFRERKVKYVQDLEKQVKDLLLYAESLKHENQMLRARGQWLSNQLKSFHRQASTRVFVQVFETAWCLENVVVQRWMRVSLWFFSWWKLKYSLDSCHGKSAKATLPALQVAGMLLSYGLLIYHN
ncbi:hypothetical protein CLAIMM_04943 [Cladophialophora immunda]|nr:hypothetical protein CLAIMM_04943 [Cladophialophora immunda]